MPSVVSWLAGWLVGSLLISCLLSYFGLGLWLSWVAVAYTAVYFSFGISQPFTSRVHFLHPHSTYHAHNETNSQRVPRQRGRSHRVRRAVQDRQRYLHVQRLQLRARGTQTFKKMNMVGF